MFYELIKIRRVDFCRKSTGLKLSPFLEVDQRGPHSREIS